MILSVIIPARNEFPNVCHTVYSILHCLETDGFKPQDFEIIIINNGSTDDKFPDRGTCGTTNYLITRGIYHNRILRVLYDPICGNHSARNKGAEIARGKYLFFSDAHMAYKPGFFKSILQTVDECKGLVHGVICWMGAYPQIESGSGYGYTIKLGEEIKGTWNNYKLADTWFYIPAQGHCSVAVDREQFLKFGGYIKTHRTYGGGEFYLDMKWWMFGSCVVCDPKAVGYHLASKRGYSYNHDDYIHNIFNVGKALSMDDWVERAYLNYLRRGNPSVLRRMWEEADREVKEERDFVLKNRKKSFNEILVERPWVKGNELRHKNHFDNLLIFHDTWLPSIKGTPAEELYNKSELQKGLEVFINKNLSNYVYKRVS